jgi:hypothetical protein
MSPDLHIIEISLKDGRAFVLIADQAHDPMSARRITLEFPLTDLGGGTYRDREVHIMAEAQAILSAASDVLHER